MLIIISCSHTVMTCWFDTAHQFMSVREQLFCKKEHTNYHLLTRDIGFPGMSLVQLRLAKMKKKSKDSELTLNTIMQAKTNRSPQTDWPWNINQKNHQNNICPICPWAECFIDTTWLFLKINLLLLRFFLHCPWLCLLLSADAVCLLSLWNKRGRSCLSVYLCPMSPPPLLSRFLSICFVCLSPYLLCFWL